MGSFPIRFHARPVASYEDSPNGTTRDAKVPVNVRHLPSLDVVQAKNLAHIGLGEPRRAVGFAVRFVESALLHTVRHVSGLIAEKQMGRIAARRIVTRVANKHAVGDGANKSGVCQSVRLPLPASDVGDSVACAMTAPLPFPATAGMRLSVNSIKQKPSDFVVGYSGHVSLLNRVTAPRVLTIPRGISLANYTSFRGLSALIFVAQSR